MNESAAAPISSVPLHANDVASPLPPGGRGTRAGSLRVAIAHRSPVARAVLRKALDDGTDIVVVGEAATGEEAVALAVHLGPDVVAMDVDLPGVGCVVATRQARAVSSAAVILLSAVGPDPRVLAALRAGAAGVVRTDSAPSDLALALARLGRGRSLRPRGRLRRRRPWEQAMQSPHVVELRRGSAHGAPVAPATPAASNPHQVGGHRWNSAS
jgi:DNA-binding NarL/FixJ family response regulator